LDTWLGRVALGRVELTEIVDTWISEPYGDRDEYHDRGSSGEAPPGGPAARGAGHGQRGHDRYYGISQQNFYVWSARYHELGPDGLKDPSRRPKTSPKATHVDVVGKILTGPRHHRIDAEEF
jgi:hypothetical protein